MKFAIEVQFVEKEPGAAHDGRITAIGGFSRYGQRWDFTEREAIEALKSGLCSFSIPSADGVCDIVVGSTEVGGDRLRLDKRNPKTSDDVCPDSASGHGNVRFGHVP